MIRVCQIGYGIMLPSKCDKHGGVDLLLEVSDTWGSERTHMTDTVPYNEQLWEHQDPVVPISESQQCDDLAMADLWAKWKNEDFCDCETQHEAYWLGTLVDEPS